MRSCALYSALSVFRFFADNVIFDTRTMEDNGILSYPWQMDNINMLPEGHTLCHQRDGWHTASSPVTVCQGKVFIPLSQIYYRSRPLFKTSLATLVTYWYKYFFEVFRNDQIGAWSLLKIWISRQNKEKTEYYTVFLMSIYTWQLCIVSVRQYLKV